ncbi:MAG: ribosomal-protein-alanine N-acetyltransferase [Gammaproteobacteria bacterium]|nr:ribosomal-protein-alanine N-acetyltransferase [Gammaproteobacteria bacterium]
MSAVLQKPDPELRPVHEHDLARIAAIEARAYEFPWTLGIFADCLRSGYCCWSLVLAEQTVGYGVMTVAMDEAHILNLCVDPVHHRQGYAQIVLDHLLALAVRHLASMVFLEVRPSNTGARRLYARNGFEQLAVRRGYYPAAVGREDALVLAKTFRSRVESRG